MHSLEVHPPARAQQQLMNSFAAESWIPLHPATQLLDQLSVIVRLATNVTLRRARLTQHAANPPLRHGIRPQATSDHLHGPPSSLRAYQFGRAASRRI